MSNVSSFGWGFFGSFNRIGHVNTDYRTISPAACLHPMIARKFHPKVTAVSVVVDSVNFSSSNRELPLNMELKSYDESGGETLVYTRSVDLRATDPYPLRVEIQLPSDLPAFGMVTWVLDRVQGGEGFTIDSVDLELEIPELPPLLEDFVWSLSMLLNNLIPDSGLVNDRSTFPEGTFINLPASARCAKILVLAAELGIVDSEDAYSVLRNLTNTLLDIVPRHSSGLLPHFVIGDGSQAAHDSEFSSVDTSLSILDLIAAWSILKDPDNQITELLEYLASINWNTFMRPDGYYAHGFSQQGALLPGSWQGFGHETFVVRLASLLGGGPLAEMKNPPSVNGSDFIMNMPAPIPNHAVDHNGNDWFALREADALKQLDWYNERNPYLRSLGLFGLSAAENPLGDQYLAYGTGGQLSPAEDGNGSIVVPHAMGLMSSFYPDDAAVAFESLKSMELFTPLSNVESLSMDPLSGEYIANQLQGAWNLALQADGLLYASPVIAELVRSAFLNIPEVQAAWDILFPGESPAWLGFAEPLADDWYFSPWFGYVYDGAAPWILSAKLGWLYPESKQPGNVFFFDWKSQSWLYTSNGLYPIFYHIERQAFILFIDGSDRWFYDYSRAEYFQL